MARKKDRVTKLAQCGKYIGTLYICTHVSAIEKWKIIQHWSVSFVCHVTTFEVLEYIIISSTEVCVYLAAIHVHIFFSLNLDMYINRIYAPHYVNKPRFIVDAVVGNNFCEMSFPNWKAIQNHFGSMRINFVYWFVQCLSFCSFECFIYFHNAFVAFSLSVLKNCVNMVFPSKSHPPNK